MIEEKIICSNCKNTAIWVIAQSIRPGGILVWYQSVSCDKCHKAVEVDDFGFPPPDIRNEIMKTEGKWNLIIGEIDSNKKLIGIRLLRDKLNYTNKEAISLSKNIPGIVYSGTKTEAEWLKGLLAGKGISASINKRS